VSDKNECDGDGGGAQEVQTHEFLARIQGPEAVYDWATAAFGLHES